MSFAVRLARVLTQRLLQMHYLLLRYPQIYRAVLILSQLVARLAISCYHHSDPKGAAD